LRTAENDGIEVFLTGDQTLTYEQNFTGRTIAIVALSSVEWDILKHHLTLMLMFNTFYHTHPVVVVHRSNTPYFESRRAVQLLPLGLRSFPAGD
jgi:hypothetical protein